jgi:hypothetical protein
VLRIKYRKRQRENSLPEITLLLNSEEDTPFSSDPSNPELIPVTRRINDRDNRVVIYEFHNLRPGRYIIQIPITVPKTKKDIEIEVI